MGRESKAERDEAFTAFMTDAMPSLLRTAWLLTGSADRSQELVQAAFVKTYAAWPRVRRESALAFARRVLVNQKTDTWRRTSREVVVVTSDPTDPLRTTARGARRPGTVLALVTPDQAVAWTEAGFELFAGRDTLDPAGYVCHDRVCSLPARTGDELRVERA